MKCQILFSGKNKKNIVNLLSAEFAQRVVQVEYSKEQTTLLKYSLIYPRKQDLEFSCKGDYFLEMSDHIFGENRKYFKISTAESFFPAC